MANPARERRVLGRRIATAHRIASDPARLEGERLSALAIIKHNIGKSFTLETLPESRVRRGSLPPRRRTPNGGKRVSLAKRRSTPPSPRRPRSNCSTTAPMTTNPVCASLAPSPSKACRRTASSRRRGRADRHSRRRRGHAPTAKAEQPADRFATMVLEHLRSAASIRAKSATRSTSRRLPAGPGIYRR